LALKEGQNITDIGAGGGYYALRFAETVGRQGTVYAVDTSKEFLEMIKNKAEEKGLNNVKAVLATKDDTGLPNKSSDIVFIRNVYHHLPNRIEYFRKLASVLKPKGKVVVIDYKRGGFNFHTIFKHSISKEIILEEMQKAGYGIIKEHDFLPKQSFTVFSLK